MGAGIFGPPVLSRPESVACSLVSAGDASAMPLASSSPMSAIESPEAVTPAGQSRFSPEFQVLLDACAVGWYEANSAWVQSVDWERALRLAEHHGVLPALYERWCGKGRGGGAEVPDAI